MKLSGKKQHKSIVNCVQKCSSYIHYTQGC